MGRQFGLIAVLTLMVLVIEFTPGCHGRTLSRRIQSRGHHSHGNRQDDDGSSGNGDNSPQTSEDGNGSSGYYYPQTSQDGSGSSGYNYPQMSEDGNGSSGNYYPQTSQDGSGSSGDNSPSTLPIDWNEIFGDSDWWSMFGENSADTGGNDNTHVSEDTDESEDTDDSEDTEDIEDTDDSGTSYNTSDDQLASLRSRLIASLKISRAKNGKGKSFSQLQTRRSSLANAAPLTKSQDSEKNILLLRMLLSKLAK